ncbi:hypothetical protein J1N35_011362 [Gossypium stocksii]|uniref:Uncharacterized protein n=1 Tax=Gossypium stocksii TaxID=47602 RepID=A0A9D4AD78_9ROSI|nr:hypothetical protein J1N35_011362 [Gossypium stocksii]
MACYNTHISTKSIHLFLPRLCMSSHNLILERRDMILKIKVDFAELSINEEEDEILQIQVDPRIDGEMRFFQLVGCFLTASIIHFLAMKSTMANLWHPV